MAGHALAVLAAQRPDWAEDQFVSWMDAMLQLEERIFGLYLAFEPGVFDPGQADYSLYEYRGGPGGALRTKLLLPPL
jgi:hypothetical protein